MRVCHVGVIAPAPLQSNSKLRFPKRQNAPTMYVCGHRPAFSCASRLPLTRTGSQVGRALHKGNDTCTHSAHKEMLHPATGIFPSNSTRGNCRLGTSDALFTNKPKNFRAARALFRASRASRRRALSKNSGIQSILVLFMGFCVAVLEIYLPI